MTRFVRLGLAALAGAWLGLAPAAHAAETPVRIGQATPALSFLPLFAARALDTFARQELKLTWASMSGGDPAALAALDAGDIDLAAVGSESVLNAAAKGQPFTIVYSLMSKVSLELVVSNSFLQRAGVGPGDPLDKRLKSLKGALIGVSAVGGAQETAARWLASKGGLDPKKDVKIAKIGAPPALQAAVENKQIDGFVLSPPAGYLVDAASAGKVLVRLGDDFPSLQNLPFLVLVAKQPIDDARRQLIERTVRALQSASDALLNDSAETAAAIHKAYFAKANRESIASAVGALKSGVAGGGRIDPAGLENLAAFTRELGGGGATAFDVKATENKVWTNFYVEAARKK